MTTKKELSGWKKYQEFLKTHAIAHHYCFQTNKCGSSTCDYCSPPRCSPDVFQGLSFLPDPLLDSTGSHFKPFDDVYGKQPNSEKDRPPDQENKDILTSTKARMIVTCCQWNKPRVVYSPLRLQPAVERHISTTWLILSSIPVDPDSTMICRKAGQWRWRRMLPLCDRSCHVRHQLNLLITPAENSRMFVLTVVTRIALLSRNWNMRIKPSCPYAKCARTLRSQSLMGNISIPLQVMHQLLKGHDCQYNNIFLKFHIVDVVY
jgi:hypothetical protein